MSSKKYIARMSCIVSMFDLAKDADSFIEEDFQNTLNEELESIESLGAEVMDISVNTLIAGEKLIKVADIEYSLTEEQYKAADKTGVPELNEGSGNKITVEVFEFIHLKSEEGLEPKEIRELFEGEKQKISNWTIRKVLNTEGFENYYKN